MPVEIIKFANHLLKKSWHCDWQQLNSVNYPAASGRGFLFQQDVLSIPKDSESYLPDPGRSPSPQDSSFSSLHDPFSLVFAQGMVSEMILVYAPRNGEFNPKRLNQGGLV